MLDFFKKLFGSGTDYSELMQKGALVIDVRTKAEYNAGHIKGSTNIPLKSLPENLNKLEAKGQPIITCCASGMRSASARQLLKSKGFQEVYNGGSWRSLQHKIK